MLEIGKLPKLPLGMQGENKSRTLQINMKDWIEDWPDATISLTVRRPGENMFYAANTFVEGGVLNWTLTRSDVEIAGEGEAQIVLLGPDDVELRSRVVKTTIGESLRGTLGELPPPEDNWVTDVLAAGEGAKADAQEAAKSASAAAADAAQVETTMKGLKEDFGNSSVFIVTAKNKSEDFPVPYADRTQDEIRAAVAAGKTCLLVYRDGRVFTYFDENVYSAADGMCPRFISGLYYNKERQLWYRYDVHVRPDGQVAMAGKPVRTATPNKFKLTGAVEAEFDGSSPVTVEIPDAASKLFVAKFAYDSTAKGYVSDKTADEIRAAAEAGKACLLVDADFGNVLVYAGDTADGPKFVHFQDASNDTFGPGIWLYEHIVTADGTVSGETHTPAKTPNPRHLVFTGAVKAEYDGSKEIVVEIPSGGACIPETADPLKQLVTDESGNVAWEDRLAYKTTEKVVNLEATALTFDSNEEAYVLSTPWTADLVAGAMCTVIYNGTDYECKAVDFHEFQPEAPIKGCMLGNMDAMGVTGIDGSNPNAPFLMVAFANDFADGSYGSFLPFDGATSVTIAVSSVVETYKTIDPNYLPKPESPYVIVKAIVNTTTGNQFTPDTVSMTYAEVLAAVKADKLVRLKLVKSDTGAMYYMECVLVEEEYGNIVFSLLDGSTGARIEAKYTSDGTMTFKLHYASTTD